MSGEQSWRFDPREGTDLEERVATWMADHDSTTDLMYAVMITGTFLAMVIFALIRQ